VLRYPDSDESYGDPRRCSRHPIEKTSDPHGLFDTPCGACEAEADGLRAVSAPKEKTAPMKKTPAVLSVYFRTTDHYSETRKFATLEGARAYAQRRIGETPEMDSYYAVSPWGDARITVRGTVGDRAASVRDLFPKVAE
jgi:hypothetical protein